MSEPHFSAQPEPELPPLPEPELGNAYYPYGKPRWSAARAVTRLRPLNGNALISFFLALFGFSIPAIIVGHVGLYQLSFLGMERGRALAWIGIILGYLEVLAWTIFGIWLAVHVAAFFAALGTGFLLPTSPAPSPSGIGELDQLLKELSQLQS